MKIKNILKNLYLYFMISIMFFISFNLVGCSAESIDGAIDVAVNSVESVKSGFKNIFLKKASDLANDNLVGNNANIYAEEDDYDMHEEQPKIDVYNPQNGGQLILSMRMPHTFNPLTNKDYTVDNILKLIFEPLFDIDPDNLKPIPNLASDFILSEDGKTITISMRDDIYWQNGTAITAQDVIFSLDVIKANPDGIYYKVLSNIAGYSINSSNSNSIIINYIEPFGFSGYDLCFPIISQAYYSNKLSEDDFENLNPMGSGNYKLLNYRLANELILEKCSNFKGTPYIDSIKVIITPDLETDVYAFERNVINSIATDFSMWGELNPNREKIATNILSNNFEYLGFNFEKEIFNNIELRKAIAYALPKDEILNNIYLSNGIKAMSPINSDIYISGKEYLEDLELYEYDIKASIEALGRANINQEQAVFNILVNAENKERIETAELMQRRLVQVGIQLNIVEKPFEEYIQDLEASNFDMFLGGIDFGVKPNLISFMTLAGLGLNGLNYQNYSDMKMDLLVQALYNAVSEQALITASIDFQRYFSEQLPVIGIVFKNHMLVTDKIVVGNKAPTLYNQYNNINEWYINQEQD